MKTVFGLRTVRRLMTLCLFACGVAQASNPVPVISSVESPNGIKDGLIITIKGSNFTEKANAKPYFYWRASDGQTPTSYGRKTTWDSAFGSEPSTVIVAKNSTQSFRNDQGVESAALAAVLFNSDTLYVNRKTYEDFDITKNVATRTRIASVIGTFSPGQVVTGTLSGATGIIQSATMDTVPAVLNFELVGGTINASIRKDFIFGEPMTSSTGTAINAEGSAQFPTGTYRTFNFKTIRLWQWEQGSDNYFGNQGSLGRKPFFVTPENTDATFSPTNIYQLPFEWKTEELYYQASSGAGIKDGIFDFRQNTAKAYDARFIQHTVLKPRKYNKLYQSQTSNGAQPHSWMYYDSLYVDDTWHHVILCSADKYQNCKKNDVQIPVNWTSDSVDVVVNLGEQDLSSAYLYVINGNGDANVNGVKICPLCPKPPTPNK